jgi:hypothetical protein
MPGFAADEYDEAVVSDASCGSQKIIAIAGDKHATTLAGQTQHLVIRRGARQHFTQLYDSVAQCFQGEGGVVLHVMVEHELHGVGADIWRATRTSISPRWSS